MALTAQQELFCRELVSRKFNATEAYLAAYPKSKPASARAAAPRLLANVSIGSRVAEIVASAAAESQITPARVVRELGFIAFQRASSVYREDGSLKAPHEWDEATEATIAGVETEEEVQYDGTSEDREPQAHGGELKRKRGKLIGTRTTKVKRWDKVRALELFMRHFGLLTEDAPHPDRTPVNLTLIPDDLKRALLARIRALRAADSTD